MSRLMGVDYGDVRTGLAVSDESGLLAVGIGTVMAAGNRKLIAEIILRASEYGVTGFVVGNPINMNGTYGPRSEKARDFARALERESGIPVTLFDERCSTMEAHSIMNLTQTRGKKRKERVDTLSAEIILQDYMDFKRSQGENI